MREWDRNGAVGVNGGFREPMEPVLPVLHRLDFIILGLRNTVSVSDEILKLGCKQRLEDWQGGPVIVWTPNQGKLYHIENWNGVKQTGKHGKRQNFRSPDTILKFYLLVTGDQFSILKATTFKSGSRVTRVELGVVEDLALPNGTFAQIVERATTESLVG